MNKMRQFSYCKECVLKKFYSFKLIEKNECLYLNFK